MLQNEKKKNSSVKLPVDIVLSPEWWFYNEKITFDEDFFYHPLRRVEVEQQMERVLYERWGKFGLGKHHNEQRPEIGAVHLAAGFLLSEMMGCKVNYSESHPPQVIAADQDKLLIDVDAVFESAAFKRTIALFDQLKSKHGYLTGDINWGGILNLAMDVRGNQILMDMMMDPDAVKAYFTQIAEVILKFTSLVKQHTGTTSISVNRVLRHLEKPVFLHSECSHTMISAEDYQEFLLPFDVEWSKQQQPFGIHYCGPDPHRMAAQFAQIPHLDFLDAGWGGDIKALREALPNTFLNIRLSPVEIINQSNEQIENTLIQLVKDSGDTCLTGVCCINIDDKVSDDKIATIFQTVEELRKENA
ncbi:hypothetical protein OU798_16915 [Prolixibacteraceae bacterium Z1-6]|uniref:Uroporphyrinogen decarboxylase (URO-D) domain-containing protein n=1 Tax=Draconibacterium aestuarii TaxID=2998507 RepID=A0A9X3J5Y5_9BACT|nr:hypothetical protein [Prolixibacteraceae bacterium Z1-6]